MKYRKQGEIFCSDGKEGKKTGAKDIVEKYLADYNDVFTDIVNVLLFSGEKVVKEEQLCSNRNKTIYKAEEEKIHEQERDIAKFWKSGNVEIALFGMENQTKMDRDMPLRVLGYDGASYRAQLLDGKKERYPVITMVLYFGDKTWSTTKSLYDCLKNLPEEWKKYVSDYKINVFEIAYLEEKQVEMFTSDFRIVADYFVQMRKNKNYIPSKETICHVDAVLKLLSVLTEDNRFEQLQKEEMEGEVSNMCEVLDHAIEKGRMEGRTEAIQKLLKAGFSENQILALDYSKEDIEKARKELLVMM